MVDTDDTRRTTDDGRRTTDDGRRTTPRVWHKLPTGELKINTPCKMAQHAIFSPRLQINSKIFYYPPFDDLSSLVLKSVTERNSEVLTLKSD